MNSELIYFFVMLIFPPIFALVVLFLIASELSKRSIKKQQLKQRQAS